MLPEKGAGCRLFFGGKEMKDGAVAGVYDQVGEVGRRYASRLQGEVLTVIIPSPSQGGRSSPQVWGVASSLWS